MIVQVYAFTDIEQACAAAIMGVNHIGFVAGDYGLVPAELSFEKAWQLRQSLPLGTRAVALTMAVDVDEIIRMALFVRPDIVHISTDMEDVGIEKMHLIRKELSAHGIKIMKAIAVSDESSVDAACFYAKESDMLLLDTKSTDIMGIGVSGKTHDWNLSRKIVETAGIPVILAGGLSAENVAESIRFVQPYGVDSNTHTNIKGDLVAKDMGRIRDFVNAVKGVEQSLERENL